MKNNASIREGATMNPLNRQLFFIGFQKRLEHYTMDREGRVIGRGSVRYGATGLR